MYFIGVDLGTSSVKLILMDERGVIENTVTREYPLSFPQNGWAEQNPQDWFDSTIDGLQELIRDTDRSQIRGLGIAGQMHGLVTLDKNDSVIRPAILWNDGRSIRETEYLNQTIGPDTLGEETGNMAFPGFTAPKILWMKANEPELFTKVRRICLPKDYLVYRLTGSFTTDYSDASGMLLLDVKNRRWSERMLDICGISEDMLPDLHESYEVAGEIKSDIKRILGIDQSQHFVVAAGAGDNAAAAIGCGVISDSMARCNISLGTSGTVFLADTDFHLAPGLRLHSFAHADGTYHLMGCMLSAASCNKWWEEEIISTKDFSSEQARILEKNLGRNGIFFMPYLMGERSPYNDPLVRGAFIGLSMDTTRADMTQAVLEGVAFGIRDSIELAKEAGVSVERSRICGGGAKSPLWRQILSDICAIPLEQVECEEGPGLGGAILASVAAGVYPSVSDAVRAIVRVKATTQPQQERVGLYDAAYHRYTQLYPMLKDFYRK